MSDPAEFRYRAVLLDLDDCLVPWQTTSHWQWAWRPRGPVLSERHVHAAIRRSLHRWDRRRWQGLVGKAPAADPAAYRAFLEETLTAIAGHALPEPETKAVVDRFLKPAHEAESYPDARPLVDLLTRSSVRVGVTTDLPTEAARLALRRAGLPETLLVGANDGPEPRLPTPAGFREAARRLDAKAVESYYVGDLFWSDVRAAGRAGLTTALIDRADQAENVLATRIRSLAELPALLRAEPPAPGPAGDEPGPS